MIEGNLFWGEYTWYNKNLNIPKNIYLLYFVNWEGYFLMPLPLARTSRVACLFHIYILLSSQ